MHVQRSTSADSDHAGDSMKCWDYQPWVVHARRAFQLLGLGLGGGGGMERLHWLLERAFDEEIGQLSTTFTSVHIVLISQHVHVTFCSQQLFRPQSTRASDGS